MYDWVEEEFIDEYDLPEPADEEEYITTGVKLLLQGGHPIAMAARDHLMQLCREHPRLVEQRFYTGPEYPSPPRFILEKLLHQWPRPDTVMNFCEEFYPNESALPEGLFPVHYACKRAEAIGDAVIPYLVRKYPNQFNKLYEGRSPVTWLAWSGNSSWRNYQHAYNGGPNEITRETVELVIRNSDIGVNIVDFLVQNAHPCTMRELRVVSTRYANALPVLEKLAKIPVAIDDLYLKFLTWNEESWSGLMNLLQSHKIKQLSIEGCQELDILAEPPTASQLKRVLSSSQSLTHLSLGVRKGTAFTDITDVLVSILEAGSVEVLSIKGLEYSFASFATALLWNKSLREFTATESRSHNSNSASDFLLQALDHNMTLIKTDCQRCPLQESVGDWMKRCGIKDAAEERQKGDRVDYYLRLNEFGRGEVRHAGTKGKFVDLLEVAQNASKFKQLQDLEKFNVLYGLLRECPATWSCDVTVLVASTSGVATAPKRKRED